MRRRSIACPVGGLWIGLLLLAGCAAPKDAHIPDFARWPYEPLARESVVAIALREWRLFGSVTQDAAADDGEPADLADKPERLPGLWQRVGEYWWLGLDRDRPEHAWTGKHDAHGRAFPPDRDGRFAWSAAFVSYVMRIAGAGARFPYSEAHSHYINAARRAALVGDQAALIWAEPIDDYAPQPGDLVCYGRGADRSLRFEDLPAPQFSSHCDIVVERAADQLSVVGGNVDDAVVLKRVPLTADGRLAGLDGIPVDARYPWLVVIRVRYEG